MTPGPPRARVVQQALADIPPERVSTVQSDRIDLLVLDHPSAAAAAHPKQMPRNMVQPQRPLGLTAWQKGVVGRSVG